LPPAKNCNVYSLSAVAAVSRRVNSSTVSRARFSVYERIDCDIKIISGLPLSLSARETHTTDGKLDAISDYIYNNGEPTEEQAAALIIELCHIDYDAPDHVIDRFHTAMLLQWQDDCEQYRITQQLQLDLAA